MNKKIFKIIPALISALCLIGGNVRHVAAEDQISNPTIISEKEYFVERDMDTLLEMASPIQTYALDVDSSTNIYEIEQLERETIYTDGTIERDYVTDYIALYDYTLENREDHSTGAYDIAITFSAYSTRYVNASQPAVYEAERLNYITTRFNDAGTNSIYVSKIEMTTHGEPNLGDQVIYRNRTINNPSSGTTYSLNSDDSRLVTNPPTISNTYGAVVYTFSNGVSTDMYDLWAIMMADERF